MAIKNKLSHILNRIINNYYYTSYTYIKNSIHKIGLTLIIISSLFFLGCSPQNVNPGFIRSSGSSDHSSRLDIPASQANAPKDVALCNRLQDPLITAQLMVYYDQYSNYRPDLLRVYIPQIHPDFEKANYQVVFRKWKADLTGETFQDSAPLKLWAERKSDRALATTAMNSLQWEQFSTEIGKTFGTTFTLKDAFTKFNFVIDLKDLTGSFDVLKLSVYKDEEWIKDWNILIPAFYAHPTTYATNQNAVLAQLHPFYGQEGSSFGTELANQLNSYCF